MSVIWQCRDRSWTFESHQPPLIMGILNATPDSFSDGGRYFDPQAALARGLQMAAEGADILDIGGESTRPGATPVPVEEELRRVIPLVAALARQTDKVLSVDTRKSQVAEQALAAGAHIINDVSALAADPAMPDVARATGAGVILMHMQGEPQTMQDQPQYADVRREVADYLRARIETAVNHGISRLALAADPGIGFGKTTRHNLALIANLDDLQALGRPVVIGLSRKRFLGQITGREAADRLAGSLGALAFALQAGAKIVRVHDVQASRDVVQIIHRLSREKHGYAE